MLFPRLLAHQLEAFRCVLGWVVVPAMVRMLSALVPLALPCLRVSVRTKWFNVPARRVLPISVRDVLAVVFVKK